MSTVKVISKLKFQHYNGRKVCCKIAKSALKKNKSVLLYTINFTSKTQPKINKNSKNDTKLEKQK